MSELNTEEHDDWLSQGFKKLKEKEALKKAMHYTFIGGKSYAIWETGNAVKSHSNDINPMSGQGCIFVYLRKDGKHHMFRELRGGWTRTYTDVQLMGKRIKEVD